MLCVQILSRHGLESTSHCTCLFSECCWGERTFAKSRSSSKDLRAQTPAAAQTRVPSTTSTTLSSELTTWRARLQQWWVCICRWCMPRRLSSQNDSFAYHWQFHTNFPNNCYKTSTFFKFGTTEVANSFLNYGDHFDIFIWDHIYCRCITLRS